MPYFPYSRQSKKKTHRGAITARMLANLMHVAGVNHVITIDLHANQMQGFFKCPVDNLVAEPLLAKWVRMNIPEWWEAVVVSKNPGGTKRVTSLADALKLSFGIVTTDRRRVHGTSLFNSAIFESIGTDGTNDRGALERDAEEAETSIRPANVGSSGQDFAHRRGQSHQRVNGELTHQDHQRHQNRQRAATSTNGRSRPTNGNGVEPSPLSRSTRLESVGTEDSVTPELQLHRVQTAPGIAQPAADEDGYEDPAGEEDSDEVRKTTLAQACFLTDGPTARSRRHNRSPHPRPHCRRRCTLTQFDTVELYSRPWRTPLK